MTRARENSSLSGLNRRWPSPRSKLIARPPNAVSASTECALYAEP